MHLRLYCFLLFLLCIISIVNSSSSSEAQNQIEEIEFDTDNMSAQQNPVHTEQKQETTTTTQQQEDETLPIHVSKVTKIEQTIKTTEGGGFIVRRPLLSASNFDPFLMLDHLGPVTYRPGEAVGAPDHPHFGQETITYVLQGQMQHKDSTGRSGELNGGDVQWMTAGKGVIHAEMPGDAMMENGGTVEGFQIWVNLPRAKKQIKPRYQELKSAKIPIWQDEDGLRAVKVIAGEHEGVHARINTQTPVGYYDVQFKAKECKDLSIDLSIAEQRVYIYVYRGSMLINDHKTPVKTGQLAVLAEFTPNSNSQRKQKVSLACASVSDPSQDNTDAKLAKRLGEQAFEVRCGALVLCGNPLNEPVYQRGPFVTTTEAEMQEVIRRYQQGKLAPQIQGADERRRQTEQANAKKNNKKNRR